MARVGGFGSGFIGLAGLAQLVIVRATTGYWPPHPASGWRCSPAQTTVLLTLGLLLSTAISPMASGIVAVGLFGATWIAGVVGGVGTALDNAAWRGSARCRGCCYRPTGCGAAR